MSIETFHRELRSQHHVDPTAEALRSMAEDPLRTLETLADGHGNLAAWQVWI